jgi:hypothetical protein
MPSSKTSKKITKNKCPYVFTKGNKKGKKCNKTCINQFCNNHNPKKIEYIKKFHEKKAADVKISKFDKILKSIEETTDLDKLPDTMKFHDKKTMLKEQMCYIMRKIIGIKICIFEKENNIYEIIPEKCEKCKYSKNNCKKHTERDEYESKLTNEYWDLVRGKCNCGNVDIYQLIKDEDINYYIQTGETYHKDEQKKLGMTLDEYVEYYRIHNYECGRCRVNGQIFYTVYKCPKESSIDDIKTYLNKKINKFNKIKDKYNKYVSILRTIALRKEKINKTILDNETRSERKLRIKQEKKQKLEHEKNQEEKIEERREKNKNDQYIQWLVKLKVQLCRNLEFIEYNLANSPDEEGYLMTKTEFEAKLILIKDVLSMLEQRIENPDPDEFTRFSKYTDNDDYKLKITMKIQNRYQKILKLGCTINTYKYAGNKNCCNKEQCQHVIKYHDKINDLSLIMLKYIIIIGRLPHMIDY